VNRLEIYPPSSAKAYGSRLLPADDVQDPPSNLIDSLYRAKCITDSIAAYTFTFNPLYIRY